MPQARSVTTANCVALAFHAATTSWACSIATPPLDAMIPIFMGPLARWAIEVLAPATRCRSNVHDCGEHFPAPQTWNQAAGQAAGWGAGRRGRPGPNLDQTRKVNGLKLVL